MTNEELQQKLEEYERRVNAQKERIELLNNAIDDFRKKCNSLIDLVKVARDQDEFDESIPEDDL